MKQALIRLRRWSTADRSGRQRAKPSKTDRTNAAKECRAERGTTDATREAFRVKYGTNKNGKNAFGKCVSRTAKDEKAERDGRRQERRQGVQGRACRRRRRVRREVRHQQERQERLRQVRVREGQGAQGRGRRGGRREGRGAQERREGVRRRAHESGEEAFAAKYGTNTNKRNAFGKCVSQTATA